jgi:hypothetical protein
MIIRAGIALPLLLALPALGWAQLELSELRGRAIAANGAPLPGAVVALLDQRGGVLRTGTCDAAGRFALQGIVPGSYYLRVTSGPLVSSLQNVIVGSALASEIEVRLAARSAETVVVTPDTELPALQTRTSLSGESVQQVPARDGRGLRAAVATTPGWSTEDNGLMHVRGVDDGFLYVIDGVPLYERFDTQFGASPEANQVSSLNVLTGHLPPEFGLKAGGVIEINTGVALRDDWSGDLEASAASESTGAGNGRLLGPLGKKAVVALYGSGGTSDRFVDPVDPGNLHGQGSAYQGDARVLLKPAERDSITFGLRYGHSEFEVSNSRDQEDAGQDQHQRLDHGVPMISWQRSWSERTVSQLAAVGFWNRNELQPSTHDIPLSTHAQRSGNRFGLLASATHSLGHHVLKGGLEVGRVHTDESFRFFVTDPEEGEEADLSDGALQFTADNPFVFEGSHSGTQLSAYGQDTWRALPSLVLNFGMRFDRSAQPTAETSFGPRFGVAYRPGRTTTLRASVDRYFQPPQLEWLLLSSSEEARVLSPFAEEGLAGGAEPRAERQWAYEVGGEQWLGQAARLDMALWYRQGTSVDDPNVFFGSTIIFPNSVGEQKARGLDVRIDVPRRKGIGGFVSYTLSKIDQYGPITGGLFLEDDFLDIGPGTKFTPDHDQRHVGLLGLSYQRGSFWVSATGRYESGTPVEVDLDELLSRPGADRVDFATGRVKPRTVFDLAAGIRLLQFGSLAVEAGAQVLNLTDEAYAYNFGNPFSGTHFGPPRTFTFKLRLASANGY